MLLKELLKAIQPVEVAGDSDIEITGVNIDSRLVEAGQLFMAMRGTQADGHAYIPAAIAKGATAILCEDMPEEPVAGITYIQVKDSEDAVGKIATTFYGDPTSKMELVGITGTNGKTTIATLLYNTFRYFGYKVGLINEQRYQHLLTKMNLIEKEKQRLEETMVGGSKEVQTFLERHESTTLKTAASLAEILRRPEMKYEYLKEIDPERPELSWDVCEQVEIDIKYDGYIKRQLKQVEQFKKLEEKRLPADIDYKEIKSLRIEAVQKLELCRPVSVGQASRISGVSPADISVLLVWLEQHRVKKQ